jgi:dolichol-phosphate mannosyltransferase
VRLDIVMPAHNEEDRIDRTLRAYRAACPDDGVRFLVALDSCTDRTPEIVNAHELLDDRVQSFDYPKLGKGGVIAETFSRSDAELVAFVDADGATPPRELLRLADAARHVDGAIASRRHPASMLPARRPLTREITSAGFASGVRMLMGRCGSAPTARRSSRRAGAWRSSGASPCPASAAPSTRTTCWSGLKAPRC